MQNNFVETLIGAIVIAVAGFFVFYAYSTTDTGRVRGYEVAARFDRVDGLAVGSDVRMRGIKIGTVSGMELDPKTYLAVVRISIAKNVSLPDDSSAKITSEGLLGNTYLSIEPGGSDVMLADGGMIENTQGSIDLMGLIGKAVFGATSEQ